MSLSVTLYNFSKKVNSTARPTGGTAYTCNLKNTCGVINPRIEFNFPMTLNPATYNYCYIELFDRYYFIQEWQYIDRLWVAFCQCDVLASWKDTIGASTLYVLRSSVNFNPNIIDMFYPLRTDFYWAKEEYTNQNWVVAPSTSLGTYVVGIVNSDSAEDGTVTYYAMSGSEMAEFRAFMLQDIGDWDSINDFTGETAKAFIDPFQYVVSCLWFPFTIAGAETKSYIRFGFWTSTVQASVLHNMRGTLNFQLARPSRTEAGVSEFKYKRPYADMFVYYEPWGIIPINPFDITADGIICHVTYDYITGVAILQIFADNGEVTAGQAEALVSVSAQIGVPMQISQITTDYQSILSNPIGAAISAYGGNMASALAEGVNGYSNGILSSAQAGLSSVQSSGSNGGIAATSLGQVCYFVAKYYSPVDEDNAHWGRPLCKNRQLSTIPGYIQVANGDFEIGCTQNEKQEIQRLLEGGFYYE